MQPFHFVTLFVIRFGCLHHYLLTSRLTLYHVWFMPFFPPYCCRNATTSYSNGIDWSTTRCPLTGWLWVACSSSACCHSLDPWQSSEVRGIPNKAVKYIRGAHTHSYAHSFTHSLTLPLSHSHKDTGWQLILWLVFLCNWSLCGKTPQNALLTQDVQVLWCLFSLSNQGTW